MAAFLLCLAPCFSRKAAAVDQYIIESIEEAQEFATQWLWTYSNDRPNVGIGGITGGFAHSGRKRSTESFPFRPNPAVKLNMTAWFYRQTPVKMGGLPFESFKMSPMDT